MRRTFFFIVAVCLATSSFASIPRASALDLSSPRFDPLSETRIRVSADLGPFERPAASELTRALRQGYEQASTTNASGLAWFLSVDPAWESANLSAPQTWNRYAYARNNPVRFTDPDGRVAIADDIVIGVAAGLILATAYVQAPNMAVPGKTNGQVMIESLASGLTSLSQGVRSLGERWKDFRANPDQWVKIDEKADPKQPPKGKSVREVWEKPTTGEIVGVHVKEPDDKKTRRGEPKHPHPFEPKVEPKDPKPAPSKPPEPSKKK
jgi:hypothetical protein